MEPTLSSSPSHVPEPYIHRLAPEVMIRMFQLNIRDHWEFDSLFAPHPHRTPNTLKQNLRHLLSISHVCYTWRMLAVSSPALWTALDDLSDERLVEFMKRSQRMPVSFFSSQKFLTPAVRTTIVEAAPRLNRLDLRHIPRAAIEAYLDFAVPALQVFTWSALDVPFERVGRADVALFHKDTPSLEALAISPRSGWLPCIHAPRLTHFYLSHFDLGGRSLLRLLSFLAHFPLLISLHLSALAAREPVVKETASLPEAHVRLSSLKTLCITRARYHHVCRFLSALTLPKNARVRLHDLRIPYSRTPALNSLNLTSIAGLERLSLAVTPQCLYLLAEGASHGVWIQCASTYTNWEPWLQALSNTLDLSSVTMLHAVLDTWLALKDVVAQLPALTTLALAHLASAPPLFIAHNLWSSLAPPEPVLCPRLETVSVQGSTLAREPHALVEALGCAMRHGRPIRSLVIDPVHVEREPAQRGRQRVTLRALVERADAPFVYAVGGGLCRWERAAFWDDGVATRYWGLAPEEQPVGVLPWTVQGEMPRGDALLLAGV